MAIHDRVAVTDHNAAARFINTVLGAWLFISAFAWPHTFAQRTNTWILGVLAVVFSLIAATVPRVRYLNTILAIWLFISAWALPRISIGTLYNNALVGIAIFIVSLVPSMATSNAPPIVGEKHPTPGM